MTTIQARARWFQAGMWLVILLAFGLRLYAIARQDIWGDEAISIWSSSKPFLPMIVGAGEPHPPLYRLLLYLWLPLAGSSPLATRFLSAFVGVLIVPLVAVLGRRLFAPGREAESRWGPLLAALLAALSPLLIYYSQETRMYALVTLLSALSVYGCLRFLQGEHRALPPYLFVTLAAVYSHYYAFFVVLAQNLVVLPSLARERRWAALKRWLLAQAALALLVIPWFFVKQDYLSSKSGDRLAGWDPRLAWDVVEGTLAALGAGLAVPHAAAWGIALPFLVAVAIGLIALLRQRRAESWLISAYFFVPLLLAALVGPLFSLPYARYLLLIAPAFLLLATRGALTVSHLWKPLGGLLALALLLSSSYGLGRYYTDEIYVRGRYGQMMAYVETQAQPGDALLLANPLQRPIFDYYRPPDIDAYFFPKPEYPLEDPRTAAELETIAAEHPRLWLVRFGNPAEYDPDGFLTRWLATHGSKAYFDGWVDADLSLYVMTGAAGAADIGSIQHPLRATLGDQVQLLGYALSSEQLTLGGTLLLTLYWQALAPMEARYTVFTHLLAADDRVVAQMDSEPQGGGLPTDRWTVGQIVQDNYALTIPADAPPGVYRIEVGLYLLATMERLPAVDAEGNPLPDNAIRLGTVEIGE